MFEALIVGGGTLTQPYGNTPFAVGCQCEWKCPGRGSNGYSFHSGIDIAARTGTVMTAVGYGQVVQIGRASLGCGGLGPFAVAIQSGGVVIWYGHANQALVGYGQLVTPGTPVARMGFLGCVWPQGPGGTHIHYEVLPVGRSSGCDSLDPGPYLTSWPGAPPSLPAPDPAIAYGQAGLWLVVGAAGALIALSSRR